jgi:hypothetical protein
MFIYFSTAKNLPIFNCVSHILFYQDLEFITLYAPISQPLQVTFYLLTTISTLSVYDRQVHWNYFTYCKFSTESILYILNFKSPHYELVSVLESYITKPPFSLRRYQIPTLFIYLYFRYDIADLRLYQLRRMFTFRSGGLCVLVYTASLLLTLSTGHRSNKSNDKLMIHATHTIDFWMLIRIST